MVVGNKKRGEGRARRKILLTLKIAKIDSLDG